MSGGARSAGGERGAEKRDEERRRFAAEGVVIPADGDRDPVVWEMPELAVAAAAATWVAPHEVSVEGVAPEPDAAAVARGQLERGSQIGRHVVEAGHRPQRVGREESSAEQRTAPARQ